jgi:hypothetical protein
MASTLDESPQQGVALMASTLDLSSSTGACIDGFYPEILRFNTSSTGGCIGGVYPGMNVSNISYSSRKIDIMTVSSMASLAFLTTEWR